MIIPKFKAILCFPGTGPVPDSTEQLNQAVKYFQVVCTPFL